MKDKLTREQSAMLIKLGVSVDKASANYVGRQVHDSTGTFADPDSVEPTFTLTDILELLPKVIGCSNLNIDVNNFLYHVAYVEWDDDENWEAVVDHLLSENFSAPELIDALHQTLVWVIKNNYYQQ